LSVVQLGFDFCKLKTQPVLPDGFEMKELPLLLFELLHDIKNTLNCFVKFMVNIVVEPKVIEVAEKDRNWPEKSPVTRNLIY
jgi:hypothetical protein